MKYAWAFFNFLTVVTRHFCVQVLNFLVVCTFDGIESKLSIAEDMLHFWYFNAPLKVCNSEAKKKK